jgi:hypothetical protein
MGKQLLRALLKAGVVKEDDTPAARSEKQRKDRNESTGEKSLPPVFDRPLLPAPTKSAPGLTSLKEPDYITPDEDGVERYRGTMHWMHKSIPVLEIHGKKNPVLTPEEIVKMRRR